MSKIKYKPLANRVLLKLIPLTDDDMMINGIRQPESAILFQKAVVIEAGLGEYARQTGTFMPSEIKKGDTVFVLREAGYIPIRYNGEDMQLRRESDVDIIIE